jgi:Transcriptional accessory protein
LTDIGADEDTIGTTKLQQQLGQLNKEKYSKQLGVGVATLTDIIAGLSKPGRDLRDSMPAPLLRQTS